MLLSPINLGKHFHHSLTNLNQKRIDINNKKNIDLKKNKINDKFKIPNPKNKSLLKWQNIDPKKIGLNHFSSNFQRKTNFLSLINPEAYNLINEKEKETINFQYIKMIRKAKQQKIQLRNNLSKFEMVYFNKSKVDDPECSKQFRHVKNSILPRSIFGSYYSLRKLPNPF